MTLVRFAPSPTGRLHVGNIRTALVNWLFARQQGGRFLLRLDDTDTERSTPEYARGIEEDMRWLGLGWDLFDRQSDRLHRYADAAERLKASGRLYPCFETPEELSLKRKAQINAGKPPVYDRAALRLSDADKGELAKSVVPHWRLRLEPGRIEWEDRVRGHVHFEAANLSDPVLIRADGRPIYTLATVVDDIDLGVTDVIRGEDHVANTAIQIQLFQALGASVPRFGHTTLIADAAGEGLSKRLGSLSIASLREDGIEAMTINSLLAHLGTSDAVEPYLSLDELVRHFDLGHFGRATPKFDPEDLPRLNHHLIQKLSFAEVKDRLPAGADERFWLAVRPNLTRVSEAAEWWPVVHGPLEPEIADPAFAEAAASLLPPEPWDETSWGSWTKAVGAATKRKGKELYLPLRLALTGRAHGPELKSLLVLIGRTRTLARLSGKEA
ncbi:MAG: glutamate--tRNA ligase [Alphaproteobacteria bacterium]|nr:glutamate--tRNA ligase [Alphaproteobacteria bacterium]